MTLVPPPATPALPPIPSGSAVASALSKAGLGPLASSLGAAGAGAIASIIFDLIFPESVADATIPESIQEPPDEPGDSSGGGSSADWGGDSGVNDDAGNPDPTTATPGKLYTLTMLAQGTVSYVNTQGTVIYVPISDIEIRDVVAPFTIEVIETVKSKTEAPVNGSTEIVWKVVGATGTKIYSVFASNGIYNIDLDYSWSGIPKNGGAPLQLTPTEPQINPNPNGAPDDNLSPIPLPPNSPSPSPAPTPTPDPNAPGAPSPVPGGGGDPNSPYPQPQPPLILDIPGLGLPLIPAPYLPPGYNPQNPPAPQVPQPQVTPSPCSTVGGCSTQMNEIINNNNANTQNIQNQLQALDLSLLAVINNKLGPQIANGGIGGALGKLFNNLKVDRILNAMTTVVVFHNAIMLSRSLIDTLGEAADSVVQALGFQFKNEEGDQVDFSEVLTGSIYNWAVALFGEEDVRQGMVAWKKAVRMYSAGANIIDNIRDITEGLREITEVCAERISIIGNALRESAVIMEENYEQFETKFNGVSKFSRAFQRFKENAEEIEESLEAINEIAEQVIEIQENAQEIKENIETWETEQKDLQEAAKDGFDEKTVNSMVQAEVSAYSFAKAEDDD